MGDRLVLIRSILCGILVYSFSLSRIPKSIVKRLRQFIFTFLWGGTVNKRMMHLADWKTISRPFNFGGWNTKNMEWFSILLKLKILWFVLGSKGLWNQVIQEKYLKKTSIESWLRLHKKSIQSASHYCNGFIRVLSWINRVLGWKGGDGESIKLGIDPIASLDTNYILSSKLLSYLNDYGICTLN